MSDLKDYIVFFKNGKTINIKANSFTWDNVNKTVKFYICEDDNDDDLELISVFHIDSVMGVSEVFENNSEDTKANDESICYKCTNYPGCFDFKEDICSCGNFSQRYFSKYYPGLEVACTKCIKEDECAVKSIIADYTPVECNGYKESKDG